MPHPPKSTDHATSQSTCEAHVGYALGVEIMAGIPLIPRIANAVPLLLDTKKEPEKLVAIAGDDGHINITRDNVWIAALKPG